MKAVQVNGFLGIEALQIKENLTEPTPKVGQILVEITASSINPFDVKFISGVFKDSIPVELPFVPGGDYAGVVIALGENVSEFKVGDEVFGSAGTVNGGSGAFAQKAAANVANSALKPTKIDALEAAAIPLVGASAVQALEEHINLQKGQRILIQGGAGGIGSMAVQIARHIGAYVAATANNNNIEFVKSLGADEVIDYTSIDFENVLNNFDAVFDTAGGDVTNKSFKILKKGGVLVSMVGAPSEELAVQYEVKALAQGTNTNSQHLKRVAELVDLGAIKPQVDKIFPIEETKEAFDYFQENSPKGKVVIKIG